MALLGRTLRSILAVAESRICPALRCTKACMACAKAMGPWPSSRMRKWPDSRPSLVPQKLSPSSTWERSWISLQCQRAEHGEVRAWPATPARRSLANQCTCRLTSRGRAQPQRLPAVHLSEASWARARTACQSSATVLSCQHQGACSAACARPAPSPSSSAHLGSGAALAQCGEYGVRGQLLQASHRQLGAALAPGQAGHELQQPDGQLEGRLQQPRHPSLPMLAQLSGRRLSCACAGHAPRCLGKQRAHGRELGWQDPGRQPTGVPGTGSAPAR